MKSRRCDAAQTSVRARGRTCAGALTEPSACSFLNHSSAAALGFITLYIYIYIFFFPPKKRPKTKSNSPNAVIGGMESPRHGAGACPRATKLTQLGWPAPCPDPRLCCGSRTKDKAHLGQKAGGKHMTRALLSTSCSRGLGGITAAGVGQLLSSSPPWIRARVPPWMPGGLGARRGASGL